MLQAGCVQMVAGCGKKNQFSHAYFNHFNSAASCGGFTYVSLVPQIGK